MSGSPRRSPRRLPIKPSQYLNELNFFSLFVWNLAKCLDVCEQNKIVPFSVCWLRNERTGVPERCCEFQLFCDPAFIVVRIVFFVSTWNGASLLLKTQWIFHLFCSFKNVLSWTASSCTGAFQPWSFTHKGEGAFCLNKLVFSQVNKKKQKKKHK